MVFEPTYSQALHHAWKLVWREKLLWIFGLLSLALSEFGLNNFIGQVLAAGFDSEETLAVLSPLISLLGVGGVWSAWLLAVLVPLAILVFSAAVIAQGALIAGAIHWYRKQRISLSGAWHAGVRHFWPLLFLTIIQKGILFGLLRGLHVATRSSSSLLTVVALAAAFLVALTIGAITIYAAGYIVSDNEHFFTAIRRAAFLFSHHLLVSLELTLLVAFTSLALSVAISAVNFLLLIPAAFFSAAAVASGWYTLFAVGAVVAEVALVVAIMLLGAIYNAFVVAAWMYLFLRMHHEGIMSRLWCAVKNRFS